jgi:drug/metabolite transporter (DMT)-like permease
MEENGYVDSVAVALVLVSAGMHAGWNAFGKGRVPTASFFLVASFGGLVLLSAAPLVWSEVTAEYERRDVMLVVTAGFFEAVYLSALAGGYRIGDLSLVYPLARALPAVTVTIGSVVLGRSDSISTLCWVGAILIVLGCVLLPQARFADLRIATYRSRAFLLALLAAAGTTGYSLVDDQALRYLRSEHPSLHPGGVTSVYSFFQVLATAGWLSLLVFSRRTGRASFRLALKDWRQVTFTGVVITLTYLIVLVALAFARDVSYVVAFRQVSIPMGALLGVVVFQESMPLPKLVGLMIIVTGLVLVSVG